MDVVVWAESEDCERQAVRIGKSTLLNLFTC